MTASLCIVMPVFNEGSTLALRLRAVTPGRFELPGAEVSDMYRPAFFARQAAARVTILP